MDSKNIPSLHRISIERGTVRLSILYEAGTVAFEADLTAPQITRLITLMAKKGKAGVRRVL